MPDLGVGDGNKGGGSGIDFGECGEAASVVDDSDVLMQPMSPVETSVAEP